MLRAALIVAAGLDIGLVILIVATFAPGWELTAATLGFGVTVAATIAALSRQLYRTGYWQARRDTFIALNEAIKRRLSLDEWIDAETERDQARARSEQPFWHRGGKR
jgi:uncharacterized membrane protein YraQ (UPF0718 family)